MQMQDLNDNLDLINLNTTYNRHGVHV
jgi:hypothetical protein